jgi:hypothetical protein
MATPAHILVSPHHIWDMQQAGPPPRPDGGDTVPQVIRTTPPPELIWSRIANAADDLARAEDVNLATASRADLVRRFEELRESLFDVLQAAKQAAQQLDQQGPY